jgi:hypothetical protein
MPVFADRQRSRVFDERARLMREARRFLLWHRAATGRVDRRRIIPKDKLTAADIEPMTLLHLE